MERAVKIPGSDHPISISRSPSRIVVKAGGRVIADSTDVLALREASYPEVLYVPRKDVDMSQLQRTSHATYCPYKGECSYYTVFPSQAATRRSTPCGPMSSLTTR